MFQSTVLCTRGTREFCVIEGRVSVHASHAMVKTTKTCTKRVHAVLIYMCAPMIAVCTSTAVS